MTSEAKCERTTNNFTMISRFRRHKSDHHVPTGESSPHAQALSEQQLNSRLTGRTAQLHPPHIAEAQVTGVSKRHLDPKRFVFQIDLTWSDGHKTASFRSYGEFFNLQCELLSQFPIEAGKQKNSQRTLPFLPGKQIFRRRNQQLAEERLPKIKNYVRELLMLPEHISQCERVLRFFQSNWKEDRIRCDMLPFQDQIEPINYCRSHTATEPILEEENDRTLNVQIVATEPIPSDVNQTSLEGYRQENSLSDGTKVEMTSFSHSDIVNQNVNHESVLDENLMSELTKESPPSYESVTKGSTTVIQAPTYTEKASSAIDNDTDMITVQPQSNVVNSPALDTDNTNSNHDISHSDIGIVYLRRRRYEIPDGDTVARWGIVICYIICIPCMILSALPS